ncbi:MAG: DUF3098 domain-containing protein [Bacteroidota bacterium]
MSQRKKKVVTTNKQSKQPAAKKTVSTKRSSTKRANTTEAASVRAKRRSVEKEPLLFGRKNYLMMLLGAGIVVLGMFLMSGGGMPDPDTWDEDIIYSTRRTILAPIVILSGLVIEIFAIFK